MDDDRSVKFVSQLFAHFPSVRHDSSPTLCVIVACYKYDLESLYHREKENLPIYCHSLRNYKYDFERSDKRRGRLIRLD